MWYCSGEQNHGTAPLFATQRIAAQSVGMMGCSKSGDAAFNADVNGVENIRQDINDSASDAKSPVSGDSSIGWLAPRVYLSDLTSGFQPGAEVVDATR